jgi:DNA mismatch repair protein MSH4
MQMLARCRGGLGRLVDVDAMLQQFAATPRTATPRTCRASVDSLIALKHTLQHLPALTSALEEAVNPLLHAIANNMAAPGLRVVGELIDEMLTQDTTWARSPLQMRQQECFAVKPGIDGNLDAVRKVSAGGRGAP